MIAAVTYPQVVLRGRRLRTDRASVMAIINRTPDSFFDHGATFDPGRALVAVERAVLAGADLVDIGGVKAGAGPAVSIAEEIDRVVPTIAAIRSAHPDLPISVDTYRAEVAAVACEAGADLINDTWAGADPHLGEVAARYGAGIVCSHTGGAAPRTNPMRVAYAEGDALLFGCETRGLPQDVLDGIAPERRLCLPMRAGNRSVNLSNAVAVVVYEAWRQLGFPGGI